MKRLAAQALLVLGTIAFTVLVFEIGVRVAGISYPMLNRHDELRGFSLRPGAAGWWRREGEAYVEINDDGLRDHEHDKPKPDDTVRIAVLGDSYAEARSVEIEDTFWAVMERELEACPRFEGKDVEAINFGVTDYGTAQELLTLRHHVWDYQPDIVLLAFFANNDVRNNSHDLEVKKYRPFFDLKDGELVLDDSFKGTRPYRLLSSWYGRLALELSDHFITLQLLNRASVNWMRKRQGEEHFAMRNAMAKEQNVEIEEGLDGGIYSPPAEPAWEKAWAITETLTSTMAAEVRDKGAEFLLVTLTSGIQTHPDPAARKAFLEEAGIENLDYPDQRMRALAEREGFDIFHLAPGLQRYAEDNDVHLHGFANTEPGSGHWNQRGHEAAGKLMADHLCGMTSGVATSLTLRRQHLARRYAARFVDG